MRQVSCPKELQDLELWCSYCGRLVKGKKYLVALRWAPNL